MEELIHRINHFITMETRASNLDITKWKILLIYNQAHVTPILIGSYRLFYWQVDSAENARNLYLGAKISFNKDYVLSETERQELIETAAIGLIAYYPLNSI